MTEENADNSFLRNETNEIPGVWVQCMEKKCKKWRYFAEVKDPDAIPDWFCCSDLPGFTCDTISAQPDPNSCYVFNDFAEGIVVWAKVDGFYWYPGIVSRDESSQSCFVFRRSLTQPTHYFVKFFGFSSFVPSSYVPASRIRRLTSVDHFLHFSDKKLINGCSYVLELNDLRKVQECPKPVRHQLDVACHEALKALLLPLQERIAKYTVISCENADQSALKDFFATGRRRSCKSKQSQPKKKRKINAPSYSMVTNSLPNFGTVLPESLLASACTCTCQCSQVVFADHSALTQRQATSCSKGIKAAGARKRGRPKSAKASGRVASGAAHCGARNERRTAVARRSLDVLPDQPLGCAFTQPNDPHPDAAQSPRSRLGIDESAFQSICQRLLSNPDEAERQLDLVSQLAEMLNASEYNASACQPTAAPLVNGDLAAPLCASDDSTESAPAADGNGTVGATVQQQQADVADCGSDESPPYDVAQLASTEQAVTETGVLLDEAAMQCVADVVRNVHAAAQSTMATNDEASVRSHVTGRPQGSSMSRPAATPSQSSLASSASASRLSAPKLPDFVSYCTSAPSAHSDVLPSTMRFAQVTAPVATKKSLSKPTSSALRSLAPHKNVPPNHAVGPPKSSQSGFNAQRSVGAEPFASSTSNVKTNKSRSFKPPAKRSVALALSQVSSDAQGELIGGSVIETSGCGSTTEQGLDAAQEASESNADGWQSRCVIRSAKHWERQGACSEGLALWSGQLSSHEWSGAGAAAEGQRQRRSSIGAEPSERTSPTCGGSQPLIRTLEQIRQKMEQQQQYGDGQAESASGDPLLKLCSSTCSQLAASQLSTRSASQPAWMCDSQSLSQPLGEGVVPLLTERSSGFGDDSDNAVPLISSVLPDADTLLQRARQIMGL